MQDVNDAGRPVLLQKIGNKDECFIRGSKTEKQMNARGRRPAAFIFFKVFGNPDQAHSPTGMTCQKEALNKANESLVFTRKYEKPVPTRGKCCTKQTTLPLYPSTSFFAYFRQTACVETL